MSNPQIIGYIVLCPSMPNGGLLQSGCGGSEEDRMVLWFGDHATIFKTRAIAKRFIARSKAFSMKYRYNWIWMYETQIVPVRGIV